MNEQWLAALLLFGVTALSAHLSWITWKWFFSVAKPSNGRGVAFAGESKLAGRGLVSPLMRRACLPLSKPLLPKLAAAVFVWRQKAL